MFLGYLILSDKEDCVSFINLSRHTLCKSAYLIIGWQTPHFLTFWAWHYLIVLEQFSSVLVHDCSGIFTQQLKWYLLTYHFAGSHSQKLFSIAVLMVSWAIVIGFLCALVFKADGDVSNDLSLYNITINSLVDSSTLVQSASCCTFALAANCCTLGLATDWSSLRTTEQLAHPKSSWPTSKVFKFK